MAFIQKIRQTTFVKSLFIVTLLIIGLATHAQNLVPNPSFENYSSCPSSSSQLNLAIPWVAPTVGTPDYFNACSSSNFADVPVNFYGSQNARTGDAYAQCVVFPSIGANYREYIQVQLTSSLIAGQNYNISFYVSLSDNSKLGCNNVGAYISVLAPSATNDLVLPFVPQINETAIITDTTNWTLISDVYTAIGGEEYITIGNFYNDASTNTIANPGGSTIHATFYYIDDVSVMPMLPPPSGSCDTLCGPNLAPNPGFEGTTVNCPDTISEMFTDYTQVDDWFGLACSTCPGSGSTPDYYNSLCNGPASTDNCGSSNGSVGFFSFAIMGSDAREYVQAQLTSPLVAGMEYCVSIDVKSNNGSPAYDRNDGLGLWFTNQMVDIDVQNGGQQFIGPGSLINATPQVENPSGNIIDTICQNVSGTFTATGIEEWVVIGNFRNDANTTSAGDCSFFCTGYLIVDDISIRTSCNNVPQPPTIGLNLSTDTICEGDCSSLSATITNGTAPFTVVWDNGVPNGIGPHNVCPTDSITYTAIVTDSAGLSDTASILLMVNPQDTATFSYPSGNYCLTDPNPLPTGIITTGGIFTIDNSGSINGTTGEIDLTTSGIGNYIVTYTTSSLCPDTATFNIVIASSTDATITQAGPFCSGDPSLNLTAVSLGGTWTGVGITDTLVGTFDPSAAGAGSHVITYTISGSCGDLDTMTIIVNLQDTATFGYPLGNYCLTDPNPLPTGIITTGGTFTIDNSGGVNATTGEIDLNTSGVGNYTVTYTTSSFCPDTAIFNVAIASNTDATITQAGPFCAGDPSLNLIAVSLGGTWTGVGITDTLVGAFDPNTAGAGSHVITYTISGSCGDVDTMTIIVNLQDTATFGYPLGNYCLTDPNPLPAGIITTGGTFTINNSGSVNATTGEINLNTSGVGNYVVTYTTTGICPDASTFNVVVASCTTPVAEYTVSDSTICEGACVTITDASTSGNTWEWTFNGGTPATSNIQNPGTVCFNAAGTYTIEQIVSNGFGADTTTSTVEVFTLPIIDAGADVAVELGESTTLNATGGGVNAVYTWNPADWLTCVVCPSTISTPEETITYTVSVVDSNGCVATDDVTVVVDYDNVVWVPNIFSPNGDGSNDILFVRGKGVESFQFVVYDRWGEKVFESTSLTEGWNGRFRGKEMNKAVFVYYLKGFFVDGTEFNQKGDITLLR